MSIVAVEIPELAVVELTQAVEGHPPGAVGTVVSAHPEEDWYTIEFTDAKGATVDMVSARADDLRVTSLT
jgi:uncharacterized protein DUF4926